MCKLQTTLTHSLTRSDRWIEKTWTGMEWSGGEKQLYKAINRMKSLFMKFATMNSNHIIFYSILAASVTHTHTHAKSQKHCRWIINGVEWPIQFKSMTNRILHGKNFHLEIAEESNIVHFYWNDAKKKRNDGRLIEPSWTNMRLNGTIAQRSMDPRSFVCRKRFIGWIEPKMHKKPKVCRVTHPMLYVVVVSLALRQYLCERNFTS